jgi:hypothetical protein
MFSLCALISFIARSAAARETSAFETHSDEVCKPITLAVPATVTDIFESRLSSRLTVATGFARDVPRLLYHQRRILGIEKLLYA